MPQTQDATWHQLSNGPSNDGLVDSYKRAFTADPFYVDFVTPMACTSG
jgi:hypothetical protein